MSQKILLDLAMKLSANSAELKRGIEESNRQLRGLNRNTQNIGRDMTMAFAKVAGAIAVVRGSMSQVRDVMNSTMTTADTLRRVTDGMAGAMETFNRSLATGNFSGFIANMQNAYRAAQAYSDILDELTKKQMAVSLKDITLAADIFMLDQIVYNEDSTEAEIRAALAQKATLYKEHYAVIQGMAEENRRALMDKMKMTMGAEIGARPEDVERSFDYVENYYRFDEERKAADKYFEILKNISDLELRRSQTAVFTGQGVARTGQDSGADIVAMQLKDMQNEAERLYQTLDGTAKWLVDNRELIDLVTPVNNQIIEAERAIRDGDAQLKQAMLRITRQERMAGSRFGRVDNIEVDTNAVSTQLTEQLGPLYEEWEQLQIGIAIDMGDYNNAIVTLQALQEEVSRLMQIRLTMSPDDEGYAAINQSISNLNEIISERLQLGLLTDPEPIAEFQERIEDLKQSFIDWQSIAVGATQGIASAFVDMAFGAKKSIDEIIREMMRFIAMQFITNMISGLFNPISTGANMLGGGGGFSPNLGAMLGGLNLQIPQMASGGLAYGPSIVQVGEYPGANLDPEIISKASDLRRILAVDSRSKNVAVTVKGMLDGEDLFISSARHIKRKNLTE